MTRKSYLVKTYLVMLGLALTLIVPAASALEVQVNGGTIAPQVVASSMFGGSIRSAISALLPGYYYSVETYEVHEGNGNVVGNMFKWEVGQAVFLAGSFLWTNGPQAGHTSAFIVHNVWYPWELSQYLRSDYYYSSSQGEKFWDSEISRIVFSGQWADVFGTSPQGNSLCQAEWTLFNVEFAACIGPTYTPLPDCPSPTPTPIIVGPSETPTEAAPTATFTEAPATVTNTPVLCLPTATPTQIVVAPTATPTVMLPQPTETPGSVDPCQFDVVGANFFLTTASVQGWSIGQICSVYFPGLTYEGGEVTDQYGHLVGCGAVLDVHGVRFFFGRFLWTDPSTPRYGQSTAIVISNERRRCPPWTPSLTTCWADWYSRDEQWSDPSNFDTLFYGFDIENRLIYGYAAGRPCYWRLDNTNQAFWLDDVDCSIADLDHDGQVNANDLIIFQKCWQTR